MRGLRGQAFSQLVAVLGQIASVPFFLHFWGVELYGEWLTVVALPAYLSLTDVGFATAATHDMTMAVARDERWAALKLFQTNWLFISGASVLVIAAIAGAALMVPVGRWLQLSQLDRWSTGLVVLLMSAYVVIHLQVGVLYAGFFCEGNYGLGSFLIAVIRLIEFVLLLILLGLGTGPIGAASAHLAGSVLGAVGMRQVLRRLSPWLVYGTRHADLATLRRTARPALAFTLFPLGNALNLQGVVVIIGVLLGSSAVVAFSALRTLARLAAASLRTVNAIVQPEVAVAFGRGDLSLLRRLHRHACQAAVWGSAAASLALLMFGEPILKIWTQGQVSMNWILFCLLLATAVSSAVWQASLMIEYATNRHQGAAVVYASVNVLAVVLAYGAGLSLGIDGIAAILLLAEMIMVLCVLRASLVYTEERLQGFTVAVLKPPLALLRLARETATGR